MVHIVPALGRTPSLRYARKTPKVQFEEALCDVCYEYVSFDRSEHRYQTYTNTVLHQ